MRHGKKINHLGRQKGHRRALLANMGTSLIMHKRINTTVAKAKALQRYIEPLITKSKEDTTNSRRTVFSYLQDKNAVSELFREVAPKVADRPGGYTRIIKTGFRQGDGAEMAMIELVDFNELYSSDKSAKKTRRSRRGGGKKAKTQEEKVEAAVEETTEVVEETKAAVEEATEEVTEAVEETKAEATEETNEEEASSDKDKKEE